MTALQNTLLAVTALAVGAAVFLLLRTVLSTQVFESFAAGLRQLEQPASDASAESAPSPVSGRTKIHLFGQVLLAHLGDWHQRLVRPEWEQRLRKSFVMMGKPELRAQDFRASQTLSAIFFGVLGLLLLNMFKKNLLSALPFFFGGYFFPYLWLKDQVEKRQKAIVRAMPYHIDLLTLSVEAGLDFAAALGKVVEKGLPGPLIEELNIVLREMRLGKTRAESLRNLGDRVGVLELSNFVGNIIQADRMGTSLAKVLRIQSGQLRTARAQRAEKLANEAPVKMLLPLVLCFFPLVFMILFGPIVFRMLYGG